MAFDPSTLGVGALGAAADFASAWYANRQSQARMHEQMDYNSAQYATRYQTQVQDLKRAGLNPMLAYMQGPGSAPTASLASVAKPDTTQSFNSTRLASAQTSNIAADTEVKEATKLNVLQDTILKASSAEMQKKQMDNLDAQIQRIGAEIQEIGQKIRTGRASEVEISNRVVLIQQQTQYEMLKQELITGQITEQGYKNRVLRPEAEVADTFFGTAGAYGKAGSNALKPLSDLMRFSPRATKSQYPRKVGGK